jgi:RNA polymerase-binding transcription factor DksA
MKTKTEAQNDLDSYRQLLIAEREELVSAFQAMLDERVGPGLAAPEEVPPLFNSRFVALPISYFDYLRFTLINSALARLGSSDDDVCIDCGGPISADCLEAVPLTRLCLSCQQAGGLKERPSVE